MEDKEFYLATIEQIVQEDKKDIIATIMDFMELEHLYESASQLVKTQLNIYDHEFGMKFQRNPIHHIESRIKSPESIVKKLQKKRLPISATSAMQNLFDIAGIRVICYYVDDIYAIAEILKLNDSYRLVKTKDYIQNPKPNGYRSFHMILTVPVHLSTTLHLVPVEIQIRTIAMDFWASLEHQLHYKTKCEVSDALTAELKDCAEIIANTDLRMQSIYHQIHSLD